MERRIPVKQSRLRSQLKANRSIRLLPLRRRIILRRRPLRSTPITLTNKETTANSPAIHLSSLLIHNLLLGLNNSSCLALIINTNDLGPKLESAAFGCRWEGLEESEGALTVEDSLVVEFGHIWDWDGC